MTEKQRKYESAKTEVIDIKALRERVNEKRAEMALEQRGREVREAAMDSGRQLYEGGKKAVLDMASWASSKSVGFLDRLIGRGVVTKEKGIVALNEAEKSVISAAKTAKETVVNDYYAVEKIALDVDEYVTEQMYQTYDNLTAKAKNTAYRVAKGTVGLIAGAMDFGAAVAEGAKGVVVGEVEYAGTTVLNAVESVVEKKKWVEDRIAETRTAIEHDTEKVQKTASEAKAGFWNRVNGAVDGFRTWLNGDRVEKLSAENQELRNKLDDLQQMLIQLNENISQQDMQPELKMAA